MHVLYATDENYVRHAAASMTSLMENNRQAEDITLHVFSMGITDESRRKLENHVAQYGRRLHVYELGDIRRWFDFSFNPRGFSPSALGRLFLARLLPEDVERVLYLDCDTIVLEDLQELFTLPMGDHYLGMAAEPTVPKARRKYLGMPDDKPYCNSGVLLVNLALWRQEDAEGQVLAYYKSKNGDLVAPDQDAINGAFSRRILQLPPRYNYGSVQIYYPWKTQQRMSAPTPFFTKDEYLQGAAKPAIIHYLGEERPWRAGSTHPYTWAYDKYLAMTPWKDAPKDEGWRLYFKCFGLFNWITKPVPMLRYKIIDALIPAFMRIRENKLKKQ